MASKDEYYQKIIASQQAEITSLKTSVADLKRDLESLKTSVNEALKSNHTTHQEECKKEQSEVKVQTLLTKIGEVFRDTIKGHIDNLKDRFVEKKDFEGYCKYSEQKFLSAGSFTSYQKSLETRLKSIEDKLGRGFCPLAINFYNQNQGKGYRSILSGLRNLKGIKIEGCLPLVALLVIAFFAVFLISSIKW